MALFGLRYDLRCPEFAKATPTELYQAAVEQCAWADGQGFATVTLSEHHGSPDGYCPSPLVLGGAIAARTQNLRLMFAALIAPLHDPIRLAEDVAVLDVLSGGRVIPVLAGGYVAPEFAAFGRKLSDRPHVMEAIVPFLERAWTGEPFEWQGRTVRVTPRPAQRPRPPIFMGGASKAAARRAARHADHFIPNLPELFDVFRDERLKLGKPDPGALPPVLANCVFVSEEPEVTWERIGPHVLHEMNAYGRWMAESGDPGPYQPVENLEELRASGEYLVLRPEELIERIGTLGPMTVVNLHPLVGGLDPEVGWESLRLVETRVLPQLRG